MKATVTYECTERDHEQRATLTVSGDFNNPGEMTLRMEFDPEVSDDTSDPTGLLTDLINSMKQIIGVEARP